MKQSNPGPDGVVIPFRFNAANGTGGKRSTEWVEGWHECSLTLAFECIWSLRMVCSYCEDLVCGRFRLRPPNCRGRNKSRHQKVSFVCARMRGQRQLAPTPAGGRHVAAGFGTCFLLSDLSPHGN